MRYRRCKLCGELHALNAWPDNHRDLPPQRSTLPSPSVIRDGLDDLWHPMDGKTYDSKAIFRRVTKEKGGIEVGNDEQKDTRFTDVVTVDEVARAKSMVDQGYRPSPAQATAQETSEMII